MKFFSALFLLTFSFSSFAFFNELECDSSMSSSRISVEVEEPFPTGSTFRWTRVFVDNNTFTYNVTVRRSGGFNQIQYWGGGIRLEVDLWPDTNPQWGRTYRGSMTSSDVRDGASIPLSCRFPNAF